MCQLRHRPVSYLLLGVIRYNEAFLIRKALAGKLGSGAAEPFVHIWMRLCFVTQLLLLLFCSVHCLLI